MIVAASFQQNAACLWHFVIRVECMVPFHIFVPPLVRGASRGSKCSLPGAPFLDPCNDLNSAIDFEMVGEEF